MKITFETMEKKKKIFSRETEKVLQIVLVPTFAYAMFVWLNRMFPNIAEPLYPWMPYHKSLIFSVSSILTISTHCWCPAILLSWISVRYVPIFLTFQVPCILVFANKWFSHQISSFGPDEFLFLGIYGLLIPILSVLIAWLKNYSLAKRKNM